MNSPTQLRIAITESPAPEGMSTKLIAVDGQGGAGKSTFAERLSILLDGAPIVHTDDFASWENPVDWWPRLIEQVLEPLAKNRSARYQRYDSDSRKMVEWQTIDPQPYLIIEGVSSSRQAFQPYLAFSIWIDTLRAERLRRGLERDGEEATAQWNQWMAGEDKYIEREKPDERANVIMDGMSQEFWRPKDR